MKAILERIESNLKACVPHVARLCLVSTFIEDVVRMWSEWSEQRDYIVTTWNCNLLLASSFITTNMFCQCLGCFLILIRHQIPFACGMLFLVIVLQTVPYILLWDIPFLLRNLALVGSLLLLSAECFAERKNSYALPSNERLTPRMFFQLVGRVCVVFMFFTLIHFEFHVVYLIENLVGAILILFIILGFKTRWASILLTIWLSVINLLTNAWWAAPNYQPLRDYLRYDFFETLAVTGGLLLIAFYGPGDLSIDERKKQW